MELPFEIILMIIENMEYNDIFRMRLVNTICRDLVDDYLGLKPMNTIDQNRLLELIKKNKRIATIYFCRRFNNISPNVALKWYDSIAYELKPIVKELREEANAKVMRTYLFMLNKNNCNLCDSDLLIERLCQYCRYDYNYYLRFEN